MFPITIFLIGLVFFTFILCYMYIGISTRVHSEESINIYKILAFSIILCFININFLSFILAFIGKYSILLLNILLWAEIIIMFTVIIIKKIRIDVRNIIIKKNFSKYMLFLLVVCFILYCFFPTQYLWARRDPALYVIKAVNIAKSGSTRFETNEYLNENYEKIEGFAELTYRGIYSEYLEGNSDLPGDNSSQFLDFFPAILAVGYSLAGLTGLFAVPGIIALLCIIASYYFIKHFLGQRLSCMAVTFLALCPAQVWGARITQTELLYQLFWILALYAFSKGWNKNSVLYAILAGSILGMIGFNRMDSYILGAGIFAVACYCNLFVHSRSKFAMKIAVSYSLFSTISFCYAYTYSYYYIVGHWKIGVLSAIILLNIFMFFASVITYIIGTKITFQKNIFYQICENRKSRLIVCWIFYFILRLVYYARPLLQKGENVDKDFNQRALMEFCWYTSTLAIPLLAIGCYYLMKNRNKRQEALLFFATGFSTLCIYILKPSVAPDHIWASRRWISVCIPFVFIIMAFAIDKIAEKVSYSHVVRIAATAGISLYLLLQCKVFIFTPMLSELPQQYTKLLENMDDDQVYFAQMSHFASILRFVYGKDVFVVKEGSADKMAQYIREEKKAVYYIGSEEYFNEDLLFEQVYKSEISGTYLDQKNEYPKELTKVGGITNIYKVSAKE